jgi:hypothetical protein
MKEEANLLPPVIRADDGHLRAHPGKSSAEPDMVGASSGSSCAIPGPAL